MLTDAQLKHLSRLRVGRIPRKGACAAACHRHGWSEVRFRCSDGKVRRDSRVKHDWDKGGRAYDLKGEFDEVLTPRGEHILKADQPDRTSLEAHQTKETPYDR